MKELIGLTLAIVGILGLAILIGIGIYSVCGWIGLVAFLCIISFLFGIALLDD